MKPDAITSDFQGLGLRLALGVGILIGELLAISFSFDALGLTRAEHSVWVQWLGYSGDAIKVGLVFAAAFVLAIGPRLTTHAAALLQAVAHHPYMGRACAHFAAFAVFFLLSGEVFGTPEKVGPSEVLMAFLWLLLALVVLGSWFVMLAPVRFWWAFIRDESLALVMALAVAVVAWFIAIYAQQLWTPLSDATFATSAFLLGAFYPDVVVDASGYVLGTQEFRVHIAAQCSGYEGIGLVVVFIMLYLSAFRADFKFPQALLLFPIGILAIWCFNAVRIVALIAIGHEFSPAVAVGGFHSQAGWISFILVTLGLLALASRLSFISHTPRLPAAVGINTPVALLIPLVVLLSSTLLTSAFAADLDWFYALRVLATGGAVWLLWRHYRLLPYLPSPLPVLAGVLVFVIWLVLVPVNEAANATIAQQLELAPALGSALWLLFRGIGAVITVPLAEELAFRGYLMERLGGGRFETNTRLTFSWLAWLGSSLLFGLLHDAWLAGVLAGLVFGLVRYRRDKVADAIVAHAVTNLLLSVYVVSTGNWSLW